MYDAQKTTLYVDDDLWQLAKVKAAVQGKTLGDYLEELIEGVTKEFASKKKEK